MNRRNFFGFLGLGALMPFAAIAASKPDVDERIIRIEWDSEDPVNRYMYEVQYFDRYRKVGVTIHTFDFYWEFNTKAERAFESITVKEIGGRGFIVDKRVTSRTLDGRDTPVIRSTVSEAMRNPSGAFTGNKYYSRYVST